MSSKQQPSPKLVYLFRKGAISLPEEKEELEALETNNLETVDLRTKLSQYPEGTVVVPRFYLWPRHNEVIEDIVESGCVPVNGKHATGYLRDILSYQEDLGPELTPWSYQWNQFLKMQMTSHTNLALKATNLALKACPWPTSGGFVLKTRERSMKERWATHMFAKDFEETKVVAANLFAAGYSPEDIVVRPHVLLNKLTDDQLPGCCPVSEEYRVFVLDGHVVAAGHYWPENKDIPQDLAFLGGFIQRVTWRLQALNSFVDDLRFYVIDVAKTINGEWIVVELNDGCTAGLPVTVDAKSFYREFKIRFLSKKKALNCVIAGSRDATYDQTIETIDSCPFKNMILYTLSGKARGADTHGEFWAALNNISVLPFPADWDKHGKAAGPIRNSEMAKGADAAIIVPKPDGTYGHGSLDMMKKMIAKLGPEQAKLLIWPTPPDELLVG